MPWALPGSLDLNHGKGRKKMILLRVSGRQAGITLKLAIHFFLKSQPRHSIVLWRWTIQMDYSCSSHTRIKYYTVPVVPIYLSKPQMTCIVLKKPLFQLKYHWGMPVVIKDHILQIKEGMLALVFRSDSLSPNCFACWISIPFTTKSLNKVALNHWRVYLEEDCVSACSKMVLRWLRGSPLPVSLHAAVCNNQTTTILLVKLLYVSTFLKRKCPAIE